MEAWKPVSFAPDYSVSDMGRFKGIRSDKIIKGTKSNTGQGYIIVSIVSSSGKKRYRLHRLVAEAFVPNPKNLPYVNHKNNNSCDNRAENLEWVTHFENVKHFMTEHGGRTNQKMTYQKAIECREMAAKGVSVSELASIYGCTYQNICSILKEVTWKDSYYL